MRSKVSELLNSNKVLITLFLVILAGSVIRLFDPTFRSLWGDEAHSFYRSYSLLSQMTGALTPSAFFGALARFTSQIISEAHLPLYFLLLSGWIKIFGPAEYFLRLFSITFGILSIWAVFVLARDLFDDRTALLSSLFMAVSPLAVFMSQEIRMYSMLLFFALLSTIMFRRAVCVKASFLNCSGYIIFTVLLCVAHVYGLILFIGQFIYLLFAFFMKLLARDEAFKVFLSQFTTAAVLFPLYLKVIERLFVFVSLNPDIAYSVFPSYLKLPLFFFVLSLGETVAPWNFLLVIPAVLVFGYLFIRMLGRFKEKETLFLLGMLLMSVCAASLLLKGTMPKYMIFVLPFYLVLLARSVIEIKNVKWAGVLAIVLVLMMSFSLANYFRIKDYHNSNQQEPWKSVASLVKNNYRRGDVILYSTDWIVKDLLNYYLNITDLGKKKSDVKNSTEYQFMNIADAEKVATDSCRRCLAVSHIADDRNLPPGRVDTSIKKLSHKYAIKNTFRFIPYEDTIVSRIPIGRHKKGTARITVEIMERRL